jgi:hypothetical protein
VIAGSDSIGGGWAIGSGGNRAGQRSRYVRRVRGSEGNEGVVQRLEERPGSFLRSMWRGCVAVGRTHDVERSRDAHVDRA